MSGVGVPASLARAFQEELTREAPRLERRPFLRQVAERAIGPQPRSGVPEDDAGSADVVADVAMEDGVALALAVVDQFATGDDGPAAVEPPDAPPVVPSPIVTGRAAASELARRARRRVARRRR